MVRNICNTPLYILCLGESRWKKQRKRKLGASEKSWVEDEKGVKVWCRFQSHITWTPVVRAEKQLLRPFALSHTRTVSSVSVLVSAYYFLFTNSLLWVFKFQFDNVSYTCDLPASYLYPPIPTFGSISFNYKNEKVPCDHS